MMNPSDSYEVDSRLIFFRIEKLEEASRNQNALRAASEALYGQRAEKLKKDLDVAHERIRELQEARNGALTKAWVTAGAASFLGILVIELVKMLLHR